MLDQLIYLLLTVVLTFVLYPFWIDFVYKFQMGEEIRGDGPTTHLKKMGTPTMGGLVFILTVSLVTFILNRSRTQTLFPIFVTSVAGLLGLWEDFSKVYKRSSLKEALKPKRSSSLFLKNILALAFRTPLGFLKNIAHTFGSTPGTGVDSAQKILVQVLLAGFVSYWTFFKLGWDFFWFPLIGNVHFGFLYPVIIFLLFLVVLNTVAFTDGLDGLAGGLAIIAFGAYWVIALSLQYYSLAALAATFIGALLPFLYFNVNPARIFMGDVGSHVLGASLALFAIVMHREIALVVILAVFLLNGLTSPLQQLSVKLTRKRLFRMAPAHHHFELLGWHETKVTFRFWLFGVFFAFFGILVALL